MDNKKETFMVRPANGAKMLETEENITAMIDYVSKRVSADRLELTKQANKALYDMAEKSGKSLWTLCYEFAPNWKPVNTALQYAKDGQDVNMRMDWELELIPLRIDWQHGEGYWEKKYKDLKEQLQKLIEEKESGTIDWKAIKTK